MIVTVTLNPAIDYTVFPEDFRPGEINRYAACSLGPGGKGVNVSLLLHSLGAETVAMGAAAGFTGRELVRLLEEVGCPADFCFLPAGHTRINFKIRSSGPENRNSLETDLNGDGPAMPEAVLEQLGKKLSALEDGDGLVLAGSLPKSLPANSYVRLLERVTGRDVLTVVDAAGETLKSALPLRPFLIKPNLEELGELFGTEIIGVETAKDCAEELRRMGARNVAVSMGERGALLSCEDGRTLFCATAKGEMVSTVGAGDSLVAGFLYGFRLHGTLEGALRWGVAAGAATAFSQGIASGDQVKALYSQVGNVHQL